MTVKIRLSRGGRKKKPSYKIVASDVRAPRDGAFIERIGYYAPLLPKSDDGRFVCDLDKLVKWLNVGAVPTDTVARLVKNYCDKEKIPQPLRFRLKI